MPKKQRPPELRTSANQICFLLPTLGKPFTNLRQPFVEAPILNHFDPEHHIQTETDALGYAIGGILGQLTSNNSNQ